MLQLAASRFLMKFVKLKIWRKALGRQGLAPADQIERGIKYARHVNHAAQHLPFEVLCLPLAMALSFMLRRRSIPHAIHPEKAPRNCLVALRTSFERTEDRRGQTSWPLAIPSPAPFRAAARYRRQAIGPTVPARGLGLRRNAKSKRTLHWIPDRCSCCWQGISAKACCLPSAIAP